METERGFDLAVHIVTMLNQVIYRAMESVMPVTVSCEFLFFDPLKLMLYRNNKGDVTRLYH